MGKNDWLTVRQLAERWGYTVNAVYIGIRTNPEKWPEFFQKTKSGKILFKLKSVLRFENREKTQPVKEIL